MQVKLCSRCRVKKPTSNFYKQKEGKFGVKAACKDCTKSIKNQHYRANSEYFKKWWNDYYHQNKSKIITKALQKRKVDPITKLRHSLSNRLNRALRGSYKSGSAVKDLGCSIPELKAHLEAQFKPGMSWENYGEWHIDHIKPLASFDLTNREELLKACNYTNLQPLWAEENLKKGRKL